MSYKDDLNDLRVAHAKRKKYRDFAVKSAKITVIALAVAFLCTLAFLIVDLATDSPSHGGGANGGDGGGASAPVITLKSGDAIYLYVGENINFREAVNVSDDSGKYDLKVDNQSLNLDAPGTYQVIYIATNPSGKSSRLVVTVVVAKKEYSKGALNAKIEELCKDLRITKQMPKKEQVKAIYNFAHNSDNIALANSSNIPNIDRKNWKTDWVEEAVRTLEKGSGDCYSYYSVSKAFFEYLGIEHDGIERENTEEHKGKGTHFWLVVNVGVDKDEWYYYDATRLRWTFGNANVNQYMMTYEDLLSYDPENNLSYDFYAFNPKNHTPYKSN